MPRLSYLRKSRRDLTLIWRWIAISNGEQRADIHPDARLLVAERWSVLYSLDGDQVRIEGIIDSSRDVGRRIFD